jgi:uncharacterized protein YkwD
MLVLSCITDTVFSQVSLHVWNNNYYNKYNYSTFQSLDIIHKEIDFNNIDYPLFNAAIFYCTNIQRVKYNKARYIHSPGLEKAAQGHSKDMVVYNFFSHTSSVTGKRTVKDRVNVYGISDAAENIALNYGKSTTYWSFALKLVEQWMNSPGHRTNILNEQYKYLGCGVYASSSSDGMVKATQNMIWGSGNTNTTTNTNPNPPDSKKDKPYKFLIKIGTSIYSDISNFEKGDNIFDLSDITIDNRLHSVLLGYRKGLSSSNDRFSNSGRDMNRGNLYGLLYNYGVLSDVSYDNLNASDLGFKELHLVYSWKEFFRISYGHGTYSEDEIFSSLLENKDYQIIGSGVNLRFGRITTDFNLSFLSLDNFKTTYNRFDVGVGINLYFIR